MAKKRNGEKAVEYAMVIEPAVGKKGPYLCAYFPDLPGCTTMGKNLGELKAKAREAIEQHLQALAGTGQPIPKPKQQVSSIQVSPPDKQVG
jgi:predicted RNase H-like HicB family nuclease